MEKREFTELFEGISREEFIRFGDYLSSPFFKAPKRISKLYDLVKTHQEEGNYVIDRELISESFYPGKNYSETQLNIRKLISEFKNYFHQFLAEREFEEREFERKLFLLKQLRHRHILNEYNKFLCETQKILDNTVTKDEEYFRMLLELSAEQYLFEGLHYKNFSEDLSFRISEYLDLYFIAYKLFLFQRLESREYVLKTNIHKHPKFYDAVLKEIEGNLEYYQEQPEIYCRYMMLKMAKDSENQCLFDEFLAYLNYADQELHINCHAYFLDLLGHCVRMVNEGKPEYEKRIIEFAGIMENKGLFKKYGISQIDMKIIIESFIGTMNYQLAEDFIKRNINYTEELHRESVYSLELAKIYFFEKEYSKSRSYLTKVAYEDYLHYVDAKLIEVRIEYEEKEFMEIPSIVETVKKYLRSHEEIGEIYKKSYLAFTNFISRLVKLYESSLTEAVNEYDIKKLREAIDSYPEQLYGYEWLTNKLNDIEKGRQ